MVGSGLGLYAARALDANGAKAVYIVGRRETTLQEAAKTGINGTIKPIVGDVSDKESLKKIVDQVRQEQGFVNLLFANAGVGGPKDRQNVNKAAGEGNTPTVEQFQKACWDAETKDYTQAYHVNCTAVYYTVLAFLELLDAGNKTRNLPQDSQVIVTSSIAGFSRHMGMSILHPCIFEFWLTCQVASSFAYSTSKAAVTHLVKMLSTAFAQNSFHIRCNVIAPGLYPSEMTTGHTSSLDKFKAPEGHDDAFAGAHSMDKASNPAERTGSEEDFAGTILFMASQAGAYLNGEALITDGGRIAQLPAVY
jgi:NAD(P)-dependent dehydrogenase (short-subunit alcohol dehydrogenase family)